ncbi:endonuclease/exonuclease/phosphatase family protein [Flavicella sp.]|uniref:endonuclease/exonuclease/phosphatase family protein n=1 Tax=Flavicella sp. TaxID=2957742 RepID=UPI00301884F1
MIDPLISIAFYNVENLFDTEDAAYTLDREFTPKGQKKWGPHRYQLKIEKLGKAISRIGENDCQLPPVFIGLAEVENSKVLDDLTQSSGLQYLPYDYVHYDSPDERGIDTALLYNTELFKILDSKAIPIIIYNSKNIRDYTRDILYVKGILNNETVHLYVNHWPSKRSGFDETRLKRIEIANILHQEIESIKEQNPKIIIMGDFNDNPIDDSIYKYLVNDKYKNPSLKLYQKGEGASKFYGKWMLFDQIILSNNFFQSNSNSLTFKTAHIFNTPFLTNPKGRHKYEPFRTYSGKYYQGGYSDHFPVYVLLEKKT